MSETTMRFEAGDGQAVVELDPDAIGSGESPWAIPTAPDWERFESLRLLAARFGDGSLAALVALRPAGAAGHDADSVSAVLVERGSSPERAHEALLSTELDAERRVRRVGLEIWTSAEPPPRRLAADRTGTRTSSVDGLEREAALMDARLDGEAGSAVFEVLRPAG